MIPILIARRAEIAGLCRRFSVRRLDLFGSATRGTDFDSARSDLDLLATYSPGHAPDIEAYLSLRDALSNLLNRPIDLVMADAVENPFVRADIERTRQVLYATWRTTTETVPRRRAEVAALLAEYGDAP